ncbi:putative ABC transporter-binding protein precursor [Variibacter gotjawalensis]|uniref:Putative ABC transporter-binding protein n=1 Tax=Variibacter gotjawalensis TaxID=1333996 RepID=A0A0S3Q164_9BRAD|nr:extracellular solute-binding protein [Variibacter gotjawalensis]NIK47772.1 multiple sugar transport system substrate-binding protein [Variibacter gotjawalensis]RZS49659.1 carbohydrate ABC transporter substrate-binding protein (CUT1 family) [Variibacter gotjawalensis]BAT61925.1 putative ABC transporter-binding protein precursor [Variibacter gotjawalensis]
MKRFFGACVAALLATAVPAAAQSFDWKSQNGQTINLMFNNHPWSQAMRDLVKDFQAKTGITARVEIFNEEQYRARLQTLMQGKSADMDVFMSLTSREGAIFNRAGWYADLAPMIKNASQTAPDFNYEDFGASIRAASTFGQQVVAIPINQEGPLFYWRKDLFEKCKVAEPKFLEELATAAAALKKCDANQGVWAARGIRSITPYALAGFVYNSGGSFMTPDGKPGMEQPNTMKGLELYATMLRDYGPPGALNHTFTQITELLGQGRVAMTHESSNEFANITRFPNRANDLGVKVLPPGKDSGVSKPVAIGWTVAISANSKRQQAAWLFLQWATSREVQTKLVNNGVAPPRASVFQGEEFNAWTKEMPIRKAWADALIELGKTGTGVYQTNTDRVPEARDIIGGAMQAIYQGKSPAEAAKTADAELAKLQ